MAQRYCADIFEVLKTLKRTRDMSFNEVKLIVSIEDPRARERRAQDIEVRDVAWACQGEGGTSDGRGRRLEQGYALGSRRPGELHTPRTLHTPSPTALLRSLPSLPQPTSPGVHRTSAACLAMRWRRR